MSSVSGGPLPFEFEVELVVGSQFPEFTWKFQPKQILFWKRPLARKQDISDAGSMSRIPAPGLSYAVLPLACSRYVQGRKEGCSGITWAAMRNDALVKQGCLEQQGCNNILLGFL